MGASAVSALLFLALILRPAVALSERADLAITPEAKQALMAAPDVVRVDTSTGRVTLRSRVATPGRKQAAGHLARYIDGVNIVDNLPRVDGALPVDTAPAQPVIVFKDRDLKKAIEKQLGERAELDSGRIRVDVHGGVARLSGSVPSQAARLSAITTAQGVPGVRAAMDELQVVRTKHDEKPAHDGGGDDASTDAGNRPPNSQLYPSGEGTGNDAGDVPLRY